MVCFQWFGRRAVAGRARTWAIAKRLRVGDYKGPMDRSSLRPLVGITACLKENGRGGWHHTVGEKYVLAAVHAVGALPVLIPAVGPELGQEERAMTEALDRLLDVLDGVL